MCVMDVRPGDTTEEIAQALLHNLSSVERDAEMIVPILRSRASKDSTAQERLNAEFAMQTLEHVTAALDLLAQAEADLAKAFGHAVGDPDPHHIFHKEIAR